MENKQEVRWCKNCESNRNHTIQQMTTPNETFPSTEYLANCMVCGKAHVYMSLIAEKKQALYIQETDNNRQSGRTTRNVDACIQTLFQTGSCTCIDHTGQRENNFYLMDKIVWRLKHEHHIQPTGLDIDRSKFTIKLKNR